MFLQEKPAGGKAPLDDEAAADDDVSGRGHILCRSCGHRITTTACRIAVNGGHLHTYFNPHGIAFEIGCFSAAPGGFVHGRPTFEFTWFAGYAWCHVHCGNCHSHLGWHFLGNDGTGFFALVLTRLREEG